MFEYSCPKCQTTSSTSTIPSGKVTSCPNCNQPLRVMAEPGSEDPPADAVPRRRGGSPWLAGVCGLVGLSGAALIVLAWAFFGRAPAPPPSDAQVARTDGPASVPEPGPVPSPIPPLGPPAPPGPIPTPEPSPVPGPIPKPSPVPGPIPTPGPAPVPGSIPTPEPPPGVLSDEEVYQKLLKSCVWIVATDGKKVKTPSGTVLNLWTGSGTLVDRDERLVLTNQHVADESCVAIFVLFPARRDDGKLITSNDYYMGQVVKKKGIPAKVVATNRRCDLALIKLESLPDGVRALPFAPRGASPAQRIHSIGGNPRGSKGQWIYSSGQVRQVSFVKWMYSDKIPREGELIESSMPINQGDSGGGVVNNRCALIGVNAMFNQRGRLTSSHIDLSEVRDFLKRYFKSVGKEWKEAEAPPPSIATRDTIRGLIAKLADADAKEREKAALALANYGPDAREAVSALLLVLRAVGEDADVRKAAKRALGEIGPPSEEQLPALLEALADLRALKPDARIYATDALGKLKEKSRSAISALVRALGDSDVRVRSNAATALGKIGPAAREEVFPGLFKAMGDRERTIRVIAAKALLDLGKPAAEHVPALKELLANRASPFEGRLYAVWALQQHGPDSAPALVGAAWGTDPVVATFAVEALGLLKVRSKEIGEVLAKTAVHPELRVRLATATALGRIGLDKTTFPGILKAINSPDASCRAAILNALPPIGAFVKSPPRFALPKEAVEDIRPLLASGEKVPRAVAAYFLGTMGAEAAPAVPDLRKALAAEKDAMAQREILCAIAAIGSKAEEAVPELTEVMNDPSDETRLQQRLAAIALAAVTKDDKVRRAAYRVLAKTLELTNTRVPNSLEKETHERARKALAKGGKGAAEMIVEVYDTSLKGTSDAKWKARLTAMHVLAKIGPSGRTLDVHKFLLRIRQRAARAGDAEMLQATKEAMASVLGGR